MKIFFIIGLFNICLVFSLNAQETIFDDLVVNGDIKSTGRLSLKANGNGVGDLISLYAERFEAENMYGFGIESTGGVLYSKAVTGHNWYIGTNADNGASAFLSLKASGYLGIGTSTPNGKLHIHGNSERLIFTSNDTQLENSFRIEFWEAPDASVSERSQFAFQYDGLNDMMRFKGSYGTDVNKDLMVIKRNGSIGIGTIYPSRSLVINGSSADNLVIKRDGGTKANNVIKFENNGQNIFIGASYNNDFAIGFSPNLGGDAKFILKNNGDAALLGKFEAREIKVQLSPTADFVFNDDYKLKKIDEVETFIKENKHLPDFPSGQKIKENGINIAEMDAKLLQKIEELTLYLIDLKKQNDRQQEQIQELEAKLATIGQHQ